MTLADAYRRLGAVLSGLESQGIEVSAVTPNEAEGAEPLVVDLRITIPSDADAPEVHFGETPAHEAVGTDGGTQVASNARSEPSSAEPEPEPEPTGKPAVDTAEGEFPCDESGCSAGFDSEAALTVHRFAEHDRPDEPLHQHEPALRAAYEAYDSFSSRTDALGVDVTAQTVRRNMMKAGIHNPETDGDGTDDGEASNEDKGSAEMGSSNEGGAATESGDPESAAEEPVTDGSGTVAASTSSAESPIPAESAAPAATPDPAEEPLPEGVTVDDLREAVVEGGSLRAVARGLDRSREEARALLAELGLLEQVHGRVATRPDREQRADAFDDWLATRRSDSASDEPSRDDS